MEEKKEEEYKPVVMGKIFSVNSIFKMYTTNEEEIIERCLGLGSRLAVRS